MVGSRTVTAIVGLAASLLLSAVLWWYVGSFVFFLFVPFVPFLLGGRDAERREQTVRTCPECGFRTSDGGFDYCPRDGTRLE